MLRLRALALMALTGVFPVASYADEPITIPAFPGTTIPTAVPQVVVPNQLPMGQPSALPTGQLPMAQPGVGVPGMAGPGGVVAPGTIPGQMMGNPNHFPEPIPLGATNPGYGAGMCPPPLPPYAWPTYAPYNNLSRVAYPTAYPYEAFPFIGPYYPFPKVPPGWRSVKLEWDDGYWWFSKTANKHNWWKVRFW